MHQCENFVGYEEKFRTSHIKEKARKLNKKWKVPMDH